LTSISKDDKDPGGTLLSDETDKYAVSDPSLFLLMLKIKLNKKDMYLKVFQSDWNYIRA